MCVGPIFTVSFHSSAFTGKSTVSPLTAGSSRPVTLTAAAMYVAEGTTVGRLATCSYDHWGVPVPYGQARCQPAVPQEIAMPPKTTLEEAYETHLLMPKAVLSGRGSEVVELAKTDLFR